MRKSGAFALGIVPTSYSSAPLSEREKRERERTKERMKEREKGREEIEVEAQDGVEGEFFRHHRSEKPVPVR